MKFGHESCSEVGEPEWTPGPWRYDERRMVVHQVGVDPDRHGHLFGVASDHPTAIANARLIAAAPALYEALERLPDIGCQRRGYQHGQTCREDEPKTALEWCWACHVGRAREAQALARGEEVDRG